MKSKSFTPRRLLRRIFSQLWMLALQFILGMMLNLLGHETSGAKHTLYTLVLVAHILNALGLVEGGVYIALKARGNGFWWAAVALFATLCSGVLNALTGQDIWSFVMACGFLLSSWLYLILYLHADRRVRKDPGYGSA